MTLTPLTPKKSLNKAYLKEKITRSEIELFKKNLIEFIDGIDEKESEEFVKNVVTKFLYNTYYSGKNQINTKGRIDLAIYEDSRPVVIIEAKRPSSSDMVTKDDINKKALHELILYYLQERIEHGNIDVKYLIITNTYEWFIFEAALFDNLFYKSPALMKDFKDWKNGRKNRPDRDFFYTDIAKPFVKSLEDEIKFTWFDLRETSEIARNENLKDDLKLIDIYKVLSPVHLLKLPFANDSNSLDKRFYSELLHLIGLEEEKEGGKKLIRRKKKPDPGSLLENTINMLEAEDRLHKLPGNGADFGEKKEERLFNIALELCITWINRILFLKLLEGQLLNYHKGDKQYRFLDSRTIPNYDELNKLFFQVLARKLNERAGSTKEKFSHVPYLNSSLFDISALEDDTIRINSLDDSVKLKVHSATVLKNDLGKKKEGELPTLQYLLEFLDAYDFTSEGKEDIQEENKTLINASVLGLIFEKINGYKDGSFFTPGFITMYMCRETIRRATVQKFNEAKGWHLESFDQLYNKIDDLKEANTIVNSLKICDPAVGSGHFLVSALNEIFAIKSDLGILCDRKGNRLREYAVEVVNDELTVFVNDEQLFEYVPGNKESQRVQEALFHEKQTLIENCLFGVDINPNSVKICRLRLWIELLKNAYYTAESKYLELETLPNIDINIKQGNSLISRFPLDADLSKALKSFTFSIDSYRGFVNDYKNATDKEAKRGFEKLIEQIKKEFRTEISKNDPKVQQLNKKSGELYTLLTQTPVFEPTDKEKKEKQKKKDKLEGEIKKLTTDIEEVKNSAIYKDAFEWRFEFPEVLDSEGNFIGFDVVIGNPPYGVKAKAIEKGFFSQSYKSVVGKYDSYGYFIEKGCRILRDAGELGFIVPHTWLTVTEAELMREYLISNSVIREIDCLPPKVFDEATVDTVNLFLTKSLPSSPYKVRIKILETQKKLLTLGQSDEFHEMPLDLEKKRSPLKINIREKELAIITKIESDTLSLSEICDLSVGIQAYDSYAGQSRDIIEQRVYHSEQKRDESFVKELNGKDVWRYGFSWPGDSWISYGEWLAHPRAKRYFDQKRILVREITLAGKYKIAACIAEEYMVNYKSILNIIPKNKKKTEVELEYILAVLNSSLMSWRFSLLSNKILTDTFPRISIYDLKDFPIKIPPTFKRSEIVNCVREVVNNDKNHPEIESLSIRIDKMIFDVYGLTLEEIAIIEGN